MLHLLEECDDLKDLYRAQGKAEQLRQMERLPEEVEKLYQIYLEQEKEERKVTKEKEQHGQPYI